VREARKKGRGRSFRRMFLEKTEDLRRVGVLKHVPLFASSLKRLCRLPNERKWRNREDKQPSGLLSLNFVEVSVEVQSMIGSDRGGSQTTEDKD